MVASSGSSAGASVRSAHCSRSAARTPGGRSRSSSCASGSSMASSSSETTSTGRPPDVAAGRPRVNREQITSTLTFWLRPEFVLRVVNRFQKVAGFDRAVALASGALTATIPLSIATSAVASRLGGKGTAQRLIDRYELTGGGAEAVKDVFSPPSGVSTSLGVIGFLFLLITVLRFSRRVQRLFEQTWEFTALSARYTV